MSSAIGLRFERRVRLLDNAGVAFQTFVAECIELAEPAGARVKTFPTSGRDGAIDIVVDGPGNDRRVFVECKYHANTRRDDPVFDWRAIAKHLTQHLPALAAMDEQAAAESPYGPWLQRARPVSEYWFCTSVVIQHESRDNQISTEIGNFFVELSKRHPRLSHLAAIVVTVRSWSYFAQIIRRRPSLGYRWFGGLPKGFGLLESHSGGSGSFQRFLDSDDLPYASVEEFAAATSIPQTRDLPSPRALLERMLSDPRGSLLISGAGGMGKTRMALEIARLAARRNILSLAVAPFADDDALRELASDHAWLDLHRGSAGAQFVYASWLNAGGAVAPISSDVRAWLEAHHNSDGAGFVYTAWLEAGGAFGW